MLWFGNTVNASGFGPEAIQKQKHATGLWTPSAAKAPPDDGA
jgi:hypothetical protein